MHQPRTGRSAALLSLAAAAVCYGTVPAFLRFLKDSLDVWTVNAVRYSLAAALWLPFVWILGRRRRAAGGAMAGRNVWRDALAPAALNLAGQVGWGASPYFVRASTIGFAVRMSFLFTVVLGLLFIPAERPLARKGRFYAGAAACVAGLAGMFVGELRQEGPSSLAGMAIILATALFYAAYAVAVRRCLAGYPARLSFGVISLYTAGGLVALMLLLGDSAALARAGRGAWLALGASAMLGIAFGHVLYYRGIHAVGAVVASGTMMATPFVTLLAATVFLKERPAGMQVLGGLAVVAGGVLLVAAQAQVEAERPARPARAESTARDKGAIHP